MKFGHLEVVRSDGVEKRGPAVSCKWSVTRLWLVGCLASRLSPGLWLVTCLISIKTASWRPIGFRSESWPLFGQLSGLWTESWLLIGQLYGLITESWPLIGQSWLPVSPRPWRKIMEAVCLILGFRITGFNDILLLCSHFVTIIITAFRSLARRGWVRGCREQILYHGHCTDAWDPTPGLLWSCW